MAPFSHCPYGVEGLNRVHGDTPAIALEVSIRTAKGFDRRFIRDTILELGELDPFPSCIALR